ncbi:calmodulin-like [Oppia nitens]|uniref:calmodulin-like n=1 Tax=Oppia nitens TaxID=1686743 RepID=UPI0023D9B2AE|nr:calmodulin-like [Oppia nitens]
MARYFSGEDIDEFRDCFYLMTHSNGTINTIDELKTIMRSLAMSPTLPELKQYFQSKGGKLSFADFLDVMHTHSVKEKVIQEVMDAFRASDGNRNGTINGRHIRHYLMDCGETIDEKLFDAVLREANINPSINANIKYEDLVRIICSPIPDY